LSGCVIKPIDGHEGGRNLVYTCEQEGKIIRIAFLNDRSLKDFLAETEYVRYLHEHGGSVDEATAMSGAKREGIFEVIQNAQNMGMDVDTITKLTGLPREEIEKLK